MKKIVVLCDSADFLLDVAAIASMQTPVGTDFLGVNLWNGNSSGNVQFLITPSDPTQKVFKSFQSAIDSAISPKSNSESIIRVQLPDGFTLTTDY